MINIINNILFSNGYERVDLELLKKDAEIYLFRPVSESKREEYFVTIKLHIQTDEAAQNLLEEKIEDLFEEISNSGEVGRSFEKNCTMLLCHEEDNIDRQTILSLEEDEYNFKKNVIAYYQQEFVAMQAYLASKKIDNITNSVINSIINADDGKAFLGFKNNHKQQRDHYSLILKIVLKLPFISYNPKEKQLINLSNDIKGSLSPSQSTIYNRLLDSDVEWNDDNLLQQVERVWGEL